MEEKRVKILDLKILNKGALFGKMKIYVSRWDLEIREVLIFKKEDQLWFSLPSKEFQDEDGQKKYMSYLRFGKPESHAGFQKVLHEEFNQYMMEHEGELEVPQKQGDPF